MTGAVVVELFILALLVATAISMIRMRQLFGVAMLSGIYSLLSAAFFVAMDAVDVAFTEAAVGAGISTVLILSGIALTAKQEMPVASATGRQRTKQAQRATHTQLPATLINLCRALIESGPINARLLGWLLGLLFVKVRVSQDHDLLPDLT